ncbi:MAG: zinc-ribbon domain-containing protein [Clostridia bacterium]|nr:zinc-ribbon domain-containing protein [Clostridia bacterium]
MAQFCKNCGAEVPADALDCPSCGASLPEPEERETFEVFPDPEKQEESGNRTAVDDAGETSEEISDETSDEILNETPDETSNETLSETSDETSDGTSDGTESGPSSEDEKEEYGEDDPLYRAPEPPRSCTYREYREEVIPASVREQKRILSLMGVVVGLAVVLFSMILWLLGGYFWNACIVFAILGTVVAVCGGINFFVRSIWLPLLPAALCLIGVLVAFRQGAGFLYYTVLIFSFLTSYMDFAGWNMVRKYYKFYRMNGALPPVPVKEPRFKRSVWLYMVLAGVMAVLILAVGVLNFVPLKDRFSLGTFEGRQYRNEYAGVYADVPSHWKTVFGEEQIRALNRSEGWFVSPTAFSYLYVACDKSYPAGSTRYAFLTYETLDDYTLEQYMDEYLRAGYSDGEELKYSYSEPKELSRPGQDPDTGLPYRRVLYSEMKIDYVYDTYADQILYAYIIEGDRKGEFLRLEVKAPSQKEADAIFDWMGIR